MQFFVALSLLLALTDGAPQNLLIEASDSVPAYEGPQMQPQPQPLPQVIQTYLPTETNEHKNEYLPANPEYIATTPGDVSSEPEPTSTDESTETSQPITLETTETPESRPMHKQTIILNAGKDLSKAITAKIVGPIVIFNSKVAAAAGALPPMLAAKGAVIGAAIATPIEIGAVAGSSLVSGITGKLVAVPISVAAGAVAKLAGAAESGEHIWNFGIEHKHQILKNGFIKIGHIILKPIAVVVGAQTALTGAGLGIAGTGIKGVGVGMETVGAKMVGTGLLAKVIGHRLIAAQFPPYLK